MLPRKTPMSKTGFFGVRAKPFSTFRVEFSDTGCRFWLGTQPTVHEVAGAFDVAVWHAGRPRKDLNFSEIETQADAELLVLGGIRMEEITTKKRPAIVVSPSDSDEAAMVRFVREHSEYVQVEQEFFWKCGAEQKKKKEDEVDRSTVIPIDSSKED